MRTPLVFLLGFSCALGACSGSSLPSSPPKPTNTAPVQAAPPTTSPSPVSLTVGPTVTPVATVPLPAGETTSTITSAPPTVPVSTIPVPTKLPSIGRIPNFTAQPTTDALQVGTSFIRAALDADTQTLRSLANSSYADAAVSLWINGAGPTGQAIIATKPISNSAGRARVAVFVDSNDLQVAALPFTVDLLQDPATQTWTVIDAGLPMP